MEECGAQHPCEYKLLESRSHLYLGSFRFYNTLGDINFFIFPIKNVSSISAIIHSKGFLPYSFPFFGIYLKILGTGNDASISAEYP